MWGSQGGRATRLLGAYLVLHFLSVGLCLQLGGEDVAGVRVGNRCIEREREALLAVRADIWAADRWLSPWERDRDCCRWEGVGCDHRTGRVVKLNLRCPYYYGLYNGTNQNQSKLKPSLLNLTRLRYLDLSGNNFGGAPIPSFIGGSLVNLEYLNLSDAGFAGTFPPVIGSLRNLRSLDLSGLHLLEIKDLQWLSHLSHLQYLYMSRVYLSTAADWLHVVNMLPSLFVLRLSGCWLPNLPTTLPHVNFSASLSTLDLSFNFFINSTWPLWPLWLFNISSLVNLDLSGNSYLHGPIPDGFDNMKRLEVLGLDGNDFEGVIPASLWKLENLTDLELTGHDLRIGSPRNMGNLKNLQSLYLGGVTDRLPESLGNLSSLRDLWLSHSIINGGLPESLANLSNLRSLHLLGNTLLGGLPESLGNLSNLSTLYLSDNTLNGGLPESLGNLSNLSTLYWSDNTLNGGLPESLGNLSKLEDLSLNSNNITGVIPESIGNLVNLNHLWLTGTNISRVLLRSIAQLCKLTGLSLNGNNNQDGAEVTELIEGLSRCHGGSILEYLDLSDNGLGGHLPDQVGHLRNLIQLDLSNNLIIGSIPASISELKSLELLRLPDNQLSGPVPSIIGKMSNLSLLDLSSNRLDGKLSEVHFANLSTLTYLDMSNNALSLRINRGWIPPFQLSIFNMRSCHVGPEFPKWLLTQKHLEYLELANNVMNDTLPNNFLNSFPSLFILDLSNNSISGPILVNAGETPLKYLDLSNNYINGSIPLSLCRMQGLTVLDMSHNHLFGQIPHCWNNGNLMVMKLSNNRLSGLIPNSIGSLLQLTSLHLNKNELIGEIPSSLSHLKQLVTLDMGDNKLSGEIPNWLGESLPSLKVLSLRSNMFSGRIPMAISYLQSLQVLDLACNKLSGTLLLSFQNLSALVKIEKDAKPLLSNSSFIYQESIMIEPKGIEIEYKRLLSLVTIIDLSGNNLSGQIPGEITRLHGLRYLNLSGNHLEGTIPENVSSLVLLESLDVSMNQLSGRIPSSMSRMSFLAHLDVSHNNLSGRIPLGGQLQTFDQHAYIGNRDLCGTPLLRPCPGDVPTQDPSFHVQEEYRNEHESSMIWLYIGIAPGFVVGFWGFIGALLLIGRGRRGAYFHFIDDFSDELYVMAIVHSRRLKLNISAWISKKLAKKWTNSAHL